MHKNVEDGIRKAWPRSAMISREICGLMEQHAATDLEATIAMFVVLMIVAKSKRNDLTKQQLCLMLAEAWDFIEPFLDQVADHVP